MLRWRQGSDTDNGELPGWLVVDGLETLIVSIDAGRCLHQPPLPYYAPTKSVPTLAGRPYQFIKPPRGPRSPMTQHQRRLTRFGGAGYPHLVNSARKMETVGYCTLILSPAKTTRPILSHWPLSMSPQAKERTQFLSTTQICTYRNRRSVFGNRLVVVLKGPLLQSCRSA